MALHVVLHWKWVTNTIGSLVRPREARKAGAGAGGAAILLAIGVATAASLALPWALPIGTGTGHSDHEGSGGQGKGHRGGRADATEAPMIPAQGKSQQGGCSDETCDGTCPTDPAALAERHGKGQAQEHTGGGGQGGVKGSMTLAEAAADGGVPVERLVTELKLPAGISPTETLGRLRRQHGFTMEDVRAAVARLKQEKRDAP